MPLINKYRIYNFKYGTDVDRLMSHQTLELEGDHLQIEASNTVGKSMSIQTIIQAICPFSNVAKTFAEVYTKKEPVCVLIEWILDDFKSKILTGIVFEKRQHFFDTNEKGRLSQMYRSVQFTIEVSPFTGMDIEVFPYLFVDDNGNKTARTVMETEELLKSLQSKLGKDKVSFYSGSYNGRKGYQKKLAEYGISQEEWKEVVIKMNDNNKEGGLSEFLKIYKTSENLMSNKIIPLIDTSLKTETDEGLKPTIEVLQTQVHDFLKAAIEMRDKLDDHNNFIALKELVTETQQKLEGVLGVEGQIKDIEDYLATIYACLENEIKKLADEKTKFEKEQEIKIEETQQIRYEEESYAYHQEMNELVKLNEEKEVQEKELAIQKQDFSLIRDRINILAYQNKHNAINREEADKARKEAEREKETKEHEEIVHELNLYGGTIHRILLSEIEELKGGYNNAKVSIENKQKDLESTKEYINGLIEKESDIKAKKMSYNRHAKEYEERVSRFIEREPAAGGFTSNGLFGFALDFENFRKFVSQQIKENERQESSNKELIKGNEVKINQNSVNIESLLEEKTPLNFKISQLKERQRVAIELEKEFNAIKEVYDFNINIKYAEDVSRLIERKVAELENENIRQLKLKTELQEEVEKLQNVKAIHIDKELVRELEKMGIHVVEGAEYLANLDGDDSFRQRLIDENELLPFSLIVEAEEYRKIVKNGISSKLTSIVPIFEKSDLSLKGVKLANGVTNFNGITAFHSFDVNILNPELRMLKIETLKERISNVSVQIENLVAEKKRLSRFYEKYQAFNYTEADSELELEIVKCEQELKNIESKVSKQQQENQTLKETNKHLQSVCEKAIRDVISLKQLLKEIDELNEMNKEIVGERKILSALNKEEQDVIRQKDYLEQKTKQLEYEVDENKTLLLVTQNNLRNTEKDISRYKTFTPNIHIRNKGLDELKATFEVYIGNSNSGRISELDAEIQRIETRLNEYLKEKEVIFKKLDKSEDEILKTIIIEDENELRAKKDDIEARINDIQAQVDSLSKEIYSKEKIGEKIKNDIAKKYKKGDVFPLNEIINFDFVLRLKENAKEIKDIADVIKDIESKGVKLSEELRTLALYKKENKKTVEVISNPIEESLKSQQLLHKLKKEKESLVEQYDNTIYDLRVFKVKHDKKYDNYIDGIEMYSDNYQKQKMQLEAVLLVIVRETERIESHTQVLEKQKAIISRMVKEHVENCITQLKIINKLGKHKGQQLFQIQLPNQSETEHALNKINALIDDIMNSGELSDVISKINSFYLLNYAISISSLPVKTLKYELNRGESKGEVIKWNEIDGKTSGAQKFCIAFVVNVVLMEYKRYSQTHSSMDNSIKGKVLLMDNPFGETTEQQFLDELFDLAAKFKVQIISYTHITNYSVRNHFNRIYTMTANPTPSNKEIVELKPIKGVKEKVNEIVNLGSYRIKDAANYSTQESLFEMD